MTQPRVVRAEDVEPRNIRGFGKEAGQVKRIVATPKFYFNIDEVNPGFSPHHWHRHDRYRAEGMEVEYPPDFEEIYFIIEGRGVIQWKTEGGATHKQAVGPGDTIYFPPGVVEHELRNDGADPIRLAVVGVPPPKRTPI